MIKSYFNSRANACGDATRWPCHAFGVTTTLSPLATANRALSVVEMRFIDDLTYLLTDPFFLLKLLYAASISLHHFFEIMLIEGRAIEPLQASQLSFIGPAWLDWQRDPFLTRERH